VALSRSKIARRVSEHESILEMQEKTEGMGISTVFDRYAAQQPKCSFGMGVVCCQLCSHGPCRIARRSSMGICRATANTIVARNPVTCVHTCPFNVFKLKEVALGKRKYHVMRPEDCEYYSACVHQCPQQAITPY